MFFIAVLLGGESFRTTNGWLGLASVFFFVAAVALSPPPVRKRDRAKYPEDNKRGGYEGWLDEIAGKRVKTLPIFLVWALLTGSAAGMAYLLGARSDTTYDVIFGVISIPFWLWAVPHHLRRQARDRT